MSSFLPFERAAAEIEEQVAELRVKAAEDPNLDVEGEIHQLEAKVGERLEAIYARLTPWQRCLIARHPMRPHASDFVRAQMSEFHLLAGDRAFAEDCAIVGGIARLRERPVMFIGQEKGSDTESRITHNFGMARPEGYRKAVRLMSLADRFAIPVVSVIDTPGAYPGRGAEERGQAGAIAHSIAAGLELGVPSVAVVLGEGGSGGAVALATANRVVMLEHAVYSVISPEGCASILWRDSEKAETAASALRLTASDMMKYGVVNSIVKEPTGGAHRNPEAALSATADAVDAELAALEGMSREEIRADRSKRFLEMK